MKTWAENEIELAIKKETAQEDCMNGYIEMCYKSALKAFNELCDEGHSGMSIQITKWGETFPMQQNAVSIQNRGQKRERDL